MTSAHTYDGRTRLIWLDADPADLDAPTMAEITAGTDLSGYLIPDSFDPGTGNSRVDDSDALTSFDNEAMGRHQSKPSALFKSKLTSGDEVAFDTLGDRLILGCLVFFEDVEEGTAIAAGATCDVYPSCQTGQPLRQATAKNTTRRFKVEWAVGAAPHLNAVVAA